MDDAPTWRSGLFSEPFAMAWRQDPEAHAPRPAAADQQRSEARYEKTWKGAREVAEKRPVFVKDMLHHTDQMRSTAFLDRITHSFRVRKPAKVIALLQRSYQKAGKEDGWEAYEISFGPQQALFDLLRARGRIPPVLDAEDLLEDLDIMVRTHCNAIVIPFLRATLSWEPSARDDVLWYDAKDENWHASLRDSDGLKPTPRKHVNLGDLPENLKSHQETFIGHYNTLYSHRLRLEIASG